MRVGYTMADLCELIFPPDMGVTGHLCMVYNCFLDDSKDQKQEQMVVSAGFFGTAKAWEQLRRAWLKRLREDGIEYFKTNEYKMLDGQFAKFKTAAFPAPTGRNKAREIRSDLQAILEEQVGIYGIGVAIPIADYEEVCARPEAKGVLQGNPYHHALESVMFETVKMVLRSPGRNMVAFVHDDGPDYDELRRVYQGFKKLNSKTAGYMGGFAPLDDKLHPPLQAADMVANYMLGLGQEWLANGREKSKLLELKRSIKLLGVWEKDYILAVLKRQLICHGKPIPIDLKGH